jgi:peptide subunit release factor RF-3
VAAFEFTIRGGRLGDEFLHRTAHPVRIAGTAGLLQFDVVAYRYMTNLATDAACGLVYFAPSMINLRLVQEKWPDVSLAATRELAPMLAA